MVDAIAASSKVPPSPSRGHRRKKTAENWDDDFEFALASNSKGTAPRPSSFRQDDKPLSAAKTNGRRSSSPIENWADEDWDHAGPSRSPPRSKRAPPPLSIPAAIGQPPRMSSSHSLSLPPASPEARTPHSASTMADRPLLAAQSSAESRAGSTLASSTSGKKKLVKRHPSTSFAPLPTTDGSRSRSNSSLLYPDDATRSSSHLARSVSKQSIRYSKSREEMPPPPTPGLLGRTSSIKQSKERTKAAADGVRESSLPFSPSSEQIEAAEAKRPGFWKRLSGAQGPPTSATGLGRSPSDRRRNRASSTGGRMPSDPSLHPPLPPYPPNLRSASSTSASSSQSAESNGSERSGPAATVSSMLRRSSSRLSEQQSPSTPPSSYPYAAYSESASRSSLSMAAPQSAPLPSAGRADPSPALASSSSFSRGFHLPSPSPRSPYNAASVGLGMPSLPHSSSFPNKLAVEKQRKGGDSDTETEADGNMQTPKRRKKIRPVSALPAPRREAGWAGDGWKGFAVSPTAPAVPVPPRQLHESPLPRRPSAPDAPAPHTAPMPSTSTFKKLATLSKQHGRRLSGGWKFGGGSPGASDSPSTGSQLETVVGSPSKLERTAGEAVTLANGRALGYGDAGHEDELRDTFRAGSVSAPGSRLQPEPLRQMASHISESGVNEAGKAEKQRRRQSWNDFVIPREVLEKQKELRQGIGAVKQFATGVESLKSLLDSHALVQSRIFQSGAHEEISLYTTLERDFAQYWEMATVLIEVGSTGQGTLDSSSSSALRSRRVTLAAEDAKVAADAVRRSYSNPDAPPAAPSTVMDQYTPKKGSLPEPGSIGLGGPPRASPSHWRASTGRQDLSKRQLEVLRTMLRTPISDSDRPSIGLRQASTLSASSTQSHITKSNILPRVLPLQSITPDDTPESKISYPSPGDSAYIVPSGSFPSPTSASIAHPQAKRRSSRAGLAGLKDFLRGLRTQKSSGNLVATPTKATGDAPPLPASIPPTPISPLQPSGAFSPDAGETDWVVYPTQRHTMATPIGPATRRGPSPEKKGQTRPSIRNIFRTSSGNWSELVRGDTESRRSSEQDRPQTATSAHFHELPIATRSSHRANPSIVDQVKAKGQNILRRPSVDQFSQSTGLGSTIEKGNTTPRSPRWSRKARPSVSGPTDAPPSPTKVHDERTVRAPRKSRIKGLGLPGEGLDHPADRGSPPVSPRKASAGTIDSIGTFASHHTFASGLTSISGDSARVTGGSRRGSEMEKEEDEGEMPTLALTPDNLPVLLEYLRQCEAKLGEWRVRAEGLLRQ